MREYIIDQESEQREPVATHRLLATMPLREQLFPDLGRFSWYIMELRLSTLGLDEPGEIDIIGSLLAPTNTDAYHTLYQEEARRHPDWEPNAIDCLATKDFVDQGGIAWPPRTDILIGIEVKCAYERDGRIKSAKTSPEKIRKLHEQLRRDLDLGLDFVGLLDIVANQPATGQGSDAWLNAMRTSCTSFDLLQQLLNGRIPQDSPVGHWAWSVGAVADGDETIRGAGGPRLLRRPTRNPHTPKRPRVEQLLATLLATLPRPRTWPVLIKDCKDCKRVHYFQEFADVHEDCQSASNQH
jgi:hypothetical protein